MNHRLYPVSPTTMLTNSMTQMLVQDIRTMFITLEQPTKWSSMFAEVCKQFIIIQKEQAELIDIPGCIN
jgi:hypothetical protein